MLKFLRFLKNLFKKKLPGDTPLAHASIKAQTPLTEKIKKVTIVKKDMKSVRQIKSTAYVKKETTAEFFKNMR